MLSQAVVDVKNSYGEALQVLNNDENSAHVVFRGRQANLQFPLEIGHNIFRRGDIIRFSRPVCFLPGAQDFASTWAKLEMRKRQALLPHIGELIQEKFGETEIGFINSRIQINLSLTQALETVSTSRQRLSDESLRNNLQRGIDSVFNQKWMLLKNKAEMLWYSREVEVMTPPDCDPKVETEILKLIWRQLMDQGFDPLITGKSRTGKVVTQIKDGIPDLWAQEDPFFMIANARREPQEIRQLRKAFPLAKPDREFKVQGMPIEEPIACRMTELFTVFADFQENVPIINDKEYALDDILVTYSGTEKLHVSTEVKERLKDDELEKRRRFLVQKKAKSKKSFEPFEGHHILRHEVVYREEIPLRLDKVLNVTSGAKGVARRTSTEFFVWIPKVPAVWEEEELWFTANHGFFQEVDSIIAATTISEKKEFNALVYAAGSMVDIKAVDPHTPASDIISEERNTHGENFWKERSLRDLSTPEGKDHSVEEAPRCSDLVGEIQDKLESKYGRRDGKFLLFRTPGVDELPDLYYDPELGDAYSFPSKPGDYIGLVRCGWCCAGFNRFARMPQTDDFAHDVFPEGARRGVRISMDMYQIAGLTLNENPEVKRNIGILAEIVAKCTQRFQSDEVFEDFSE
jgi:hypothetical protein